MTLAVDPARVYLFGADGAAPLDRPSAHRSRRPTLLVADRVWSRARPVLASAHVDAAPEGYHDDSARSPSSSSPRSSTASSSPVPRPALRHALATSVIGGQLFDRFNRPPGRSRRSRRLVAALRTRAPSWRRCLVPDLAGLARRSRMPHPSGRRRRDPSHRIGCVKSRRRRPASSIATARCRSTRANGSSTSGSSIRRRNRRGIRPSRRRVGAGQHACRRRARPHRAVRGHRARPRPLWERGERG